MHLNLNISLVKKIKLVDLQPLGLSTENSVLLSVILIKTTIHVVKPLDFFSKVTNTDYFIKLEHFFHIVRFGQRKKAV